jgi:serine/threonine protein kinase
MMQRMQHPHIIQLFEVMETENCYYIVMELIEGIEFVKYLSKRRSLDENETRQYIRQICSAVDHMHKAKVVHRDIKLQNFMLDQNQNLTIIDFGLSNSLDDREFLNTQCGSPAYAAPEIFAHQDYGPEVDIWSIGVNMYAMLAGKLPFKVENRSKNLAKLHACILKGFEVPPFLSPGQTELFFFSCKN